MRGANDGLREVNERFYSGTPIKKEDKNVSCQL